MTETAASAHATGVLFVHSCPKALAPHVEWALARQIGRVVKLDWAKQPLMPGTVRAEAIWRGPIGTASEVSSALFGWQHIRFEITEDATAASDGGRWLHTPNLGICHVQTDRAGNAVLTEHVLRRVVESAQAAPGKIALAVDRLLAGPWDAELEAFRLAEEGDAEIVPLHRVG